MGGTLFADSRNDDLGEDANFVIYGHNMDDGSMFQPLVKYKDQAYYDANPVMYYLTPYGNYRLELFAGLVVRRDDPIYKITKPSAEFQNLLKEYKEKSTFTSSVEWTEGDMIVTLSTCSYEYNHARYIVIGKLVPIHEWCFLIKKSAEKSADFVVFCSEMNKKSMGNMPKKTGNARIER